MPQDPFFLLCIEPSFPGRLGSVADWLVRRRGYHCLFCCTSAEPHSHWPAAAGCGLDVVQFTVGGVAREAAVPWWRDLERGLCYAYGCWEVLHARRPRGLDLALGRSAGLGSSLFAPVFQPGLPVVNFLDYFHHAHAHDLTAELGPQMPPAYFHWRRSAGAMDLLDLENADLAWTTTAWQRSLFPREYQHDFLVLHPGIDTARFRPRPERPRVLAGRTLPAGTRVVSFVARRPDRVRGFDRFAALANRLLTERPDVVCIAVGGGPVQRGLDVEWFGKDYAASVLRERPPHDPERFWMLGPLPPAGVADVLAASDLHVYPGRPYPVADSLLQAMASGCPVLAWDTEPVREVLEQGRTGLLVPPEDSDEQVRRAREVLADPGEYAPLGQAAAEVVRQRHAQDVTLPVLAEHFDRLVRERG
jgi:glycosyltransferase involved in cell wall biosynthesis